MVLGAIFVPALPLITAVCSLRLIPTWALLRSLVDPVPSSRVLCSLCSRCCLCPHTVHGAGEAGAGTPGPAAQEADHRRVHPWLDGVCAGPGAVRHPALRGARRLPAARELPKTQARSEGLDVVYLYERAFCELRLSWTVAFLWNIFLKRSKMSIACTPALTFPHCVWGRSGRMGPFFCWKGRRWAAFSSYLNISMCRFSRHKWQQKIIHVTQWERWVWFARIRQQKLEAHERCSNAGLRCVVGMESFADCCNFYSQVPVQIALPQQKSMLPWGDGVFAVHSPCKPTAVIVVV